MSATHRMTALTAAGLLAASALVGCGDTTGSTPQLVDQQTTRQAVTQNTHSASVDVSAALDFMRQTDMLAGLVGELDGFGASAKCSGAAPMPAQPSTDGGTGTPTGSDGSTAPPADCTSGDPQPIDQDINDGADALIDELNNRVFVDANVEAQTDTEITYLLHGSTVCQADDFEQADELQNCVDQVDQLQLRLSVTSLAQGDVDIEVLVGPDCYNPVDLELHHDLLAATVDLGQLRSTLVFASNVTDADLDKLPATMQGKVRGEFHHTGDQATLTLGVLQKVLIADTDYELHVDKAQPAAQLRVDAAAKTVHALLDMNAVDLRLPITETTGSGSTGTDPIETQTTYELAGHLGGASLDASYAAGDEHIDVHNAGLGNTTSTLAIDGKRVLAVDLNKMHGRKLDFTISKTDQGLEWSVDPVFELEVMLQFAQAQDLLDQADDWTLDNLIQVTLDGAAKPALRFGDNGIEVLAGQLHLSSTSAGVDETVGAGQCLLAPADDQTTYNGGTDSGSADVPPVDDSSSSHDPLADLSVGACQ